MAAEVGDSRWQASALQQVRKQVARRVVVAQQAAMAPLLSVEVASAQERSSTVWSRDPQSQAATPPGEHSMTDQACQTEGPHEIHRRGFPVSSDRTSWRISQTSWRISQKSLAWSF